MASVSLSPEMDVFKFMSSESYPFGVEFEFLASNYDDRFMVRCLTCHKIKLSWNYVFTTKELLPYRDYLYLGSLICQLRELLVKHAQGHGNEVTQALLRKFLPEFAIPEKEYYIIPDEKWKVIAEPAGRLIELGESENEI